MRGRRVPDRATTFLGLGLGRLLFGRKQRVLPEGVAQALCERLGIGARIARERIVVAQLTQGFRRDSQAADRQDTLCTAIGVIPLQRFLSGHDRLSVMVCGELDLRDARPGFFAGRIIFCELLI